MYVIYVSHILISFVLHCSLQCTATANRPHLLHPFAAVPVPPYLITYLLTYLLTYSMEQSPS
jgi:hypothetical protein